MKKLNSFGKQFLSPISGQKRFLVLGAALLIWTTAGCSSSPKGPQTSDEVLYFKGGNCSEHPCTLRKDGAGNIMVTNEKGVSGYGYLRGENKIHVTGWNQLEGTLSYFEGRITAIYWVNGHKWLKD